MKSRHIAKLCQNKTEVQYITGEKTLCASNKNWSQKNYRAIRSTIRLVDKRCRSSPIGQ